MGSLPRSRWQTKLIADEAKTTLLLGPHICPCFPALPGASCPCNTCQHCAYQVGAARDSLAKIRLVHGEGKYTRSKTSFTGARVFQEAVGCPLGPEHCIRAGRTPESFHKLGILYIGSYLWCYLSSAFPTFLDGLITSAFTSCCLLYLVF